MITQTLAAGGDRSAALIWFVRRMDASDVEALRQAVDEATSGDGSSIAFDRAYAEARFRYTTAGPGGNGEENSTVRSDSTRSTSLAVVSRVVTSNHSTW